MAVVGDAPLHPAGWWAPYRLRTFFTAQFSLEAASGTASGTVPVDRRLAFPDSTAGAMKAGPNGRDMEHSSTCVVRLSLLVCTRVYLACDDPSAHGGGSPAL